MAMTEMGSRAALVTLVPCPRCGSTLHVARTLAGRRGRCRTCRVRFLIGAGGSALRPAPVSRLALVCGFSVFGLALVGGGMWVWSWGGSNAAPNEPALVRDTPAPARLLAQQADLRDEAATPADNLGDRSPNEVLQFKDKKDKKPKGKPKPKDKAPKEGDIPPGWHGDYSQALAVAKKTGKPLFVVFRCER